MTPSALAPRPCLAVGAAAIALAVAAAVPMSPVAAATGALTITDASDTPYAFDSQPGKYPSVTAIDPALDPQVFFDGGDFTFPEVTPAQATRGDVYPTVTGVVDAPVALCAADTITLTLTYDYVLNGPAAGSGATAATGFLDDRVRVGTVTGLPGNNPPVGTSGTVTAVATVPTQDLLDGDIEFYASFEGIHDGQKSWDMTGLQITYAAECPPVAAADAAETEVDVPVSINPLANDSADDGRTLDPTSVRLLDGEGTEVVQLVTDEGTFAVDTLTGQITFAPAEGFTGTAGPVGYRVADDLGNTADSTVTVEIAPADDSGGTPDTPATPATPPAPGTPGPTPVDGPRGVLPDTGADGSMLGLLAAGITLVAAGVATVALRRRRFTA